MDQTTFCMMPYLTHCPPGDFCGGSEPSASVYEACATQRHPASMKTRWVKEEPKRLGLMDRGLLQTSKWGMIRGSWK